MGLARERAHFASAPPVPLRGMAYARIVPDESSKTAMGVIVLKCRKCSLVIAPEESIIMITCGSPSRFEKCEITWHARCAPMIVRQYVPETKGGFALQGGERQD